MAGRVRATREVRREFWRAYLSGATIEAAAERVGYEKTIGVRWLQQAGGVTPSFVKSTPSTRFLSIAEREKILSGVSQGWSIRRIAAEIERHPSTVLRELRRNMPHRYRTRRALFGSATKPRVREWGYQPHRAQRRAGERGSRPKPAKLAVNERLREEVQRRLEEEHSPEQIANRLREEHPDDPAMQVSHETIYQSLYVQSRGALRRDLTQRLRTGRALRKPRRKSTERRDRIPNMVSISERPAEVEDRAVPGHWEGDLIVGSVASNSAIGTLVERTTRFVILLPLPNGHGAEAVADAMVAAMSRLPEFLRKTLTYDQGNEMTNHAQIAAATALEIYFCDPHSPWQRGTNENTNGLLRQYFPKGTDLGIYQADYLDHVARKLNTRPRKTLNWRTPAEALDRLLSEAPDQAGVALTG
jgi:transposase, IS30 family